MGANGKGMTKDERPRKEGSGITLSYQAHITRLSVTILYRTY